MNAKICGRIYSDEPFFPDWGKDKKFPHYEEESEHLWEVDCASLDEAEGWLMENHPEAYMGASIVLENGDFAMFAVPCLEYGKGNFETKAARLEYARNTVRAKKRLTKWNGSKWVLPQGLTSNGESYWRLIAERLASYENTGLEPDEILKLKGEQK